jgi:hypothetical protein
MDMGRENIQVVQHMKVTGVMEFQGAIVFLHGQMGKYMKDNGIITSQMDTVRLLCLMGQYMKDNGKTVILFANRIKMDCILNGSYKYIII